MKHLLLAACALLIAASCIKDPDSIELLYPPDTGSDTPPAEELHTGSEEDLDAAQPEPDAHQPEPDAHQPEPLPACNTFRDLFLLAAAPPTVSIPSPVIAGGAFAVRVEDIVASGAPSGNLGLEITTRDDGSCISRAESVCNEGANLHDFGHAQAPADPGQYCLFITANSGTTYITAVELDVTPGTPLSCEQAQIGGCDAPCNFQGC